MIAQDLALVEMQGLVRTCRESREAFRTAAQVVKSPRLAAELMSFGDQRHDFAMAMQVMLMTLGLEPLDAAGEPSRVRRLPVASEADVDVLATCERLEAQAAADYAAAQKDSWPSSVQEMINTHLRSFRLAEKRLKLMRVQEATV